MKRFNMKIQMSILSLVLLALSQAAAAPLGDGFLYQGRLTAGGVPAHGEFDLKLTLFDAPAAGNSVGVTLTNQNVAVSNGLFTTTVDFGPGVFNGDTYWIEVAVRPGFSVSSFGAPLLPRQPILGTPYALHAINAEQLNGLSTDAFWKLGGNADAVSGRDFIGTTDRVDLEFRVGNDRILLLDRTLSTPNLIGGGSDNEILSSAVGVTIGGGDNNDVGGDYGHIGGGQDNVISNTGDYGTIPGGQGGAAFNHGQQAYASGSFAAAGDAQTSVYVLRGSTLLADPIKELFLDGTSERMQIPRNTVWAFDILVVASAADGAAGGFQAKGVVKRVGGNTSMVGGASPLIANSIGLERGFWEVMIHADNALDALTIFVRGETSQEVRWVATVRTSEVVF